MINHFLTLTKEMSYKRRKVFALSVCIMMIIHTTCLFHPILLAKILDDFLNKEYENLQNILGLYIALSIGVAMIFPLKEYLITNLIENSRKRLSLKWNQRIFNKDYYHIKQKNTSEIVEIFDRTSEQLSYFMRQIWDIYLPEICKIFAVSVYIIYIGMIEIIPYLLFFSCLTTWISKRFMRKLRPLMDEVNSLDHKSYSYFSDLIHCAPTIKMMQAYGSATKGFATLFKTFHRKQTQAAFWEFIAYGSCQGVVLIAQAAILLYAVWLIGYSSERDYTVGSLIAVYVYASILLHSLEKLVYIIYDNELWASEKSFIDTILHLPARASTHTNLAKPLRKNSLTIAKLSANNSHRLRISSQQDIHIPFNSKVLITGESGQGKTFVAELISGMQRIPLTIYWADQDTAQWSLEDIQDIFYLAETHTPFIDGTFKESILYGKNHPHSTATINNHLKHLFMDMCIPYLHQTQPFPHQQLSLGERKRLAILRAILLQRPVTILDNPLDGIDSKIKNHVWNYLLENLQGSTLICVGYDDHPCTNPVSSFDLHLHLSNHTLTVMP
ncbi:MAG: ABC transporter ATP-binding protein [Proteobacteria bacterium]|nr:ABC transporter ATP-binding protein [Pseudomonadota bacterium]